MTAIITKAQIETELISITKTITGFADSNIRKAFKGQGQPSVAIDQDYAYLYINFQDSPIDKIIETGINPQAGTVHIADNVKTYTRLISCNWILYGPNSFDIADKIKIFLDYNDITKNLRKNNIFWVCNMDAPSRMPYQLNGQWFERADLSVQFYQRMTYKRDVNYIESAEVIVKTDTGLERDINIIKGD